MTFWKTLFGRKEEDNMEEATGVPEGVTTNSYPDEEGEVECKWCGHEQEYEIQIIEGQREYTVRCDECKLKIWISGDGEEKYKKIHDLEEGCRKAADSSGNLNPTMGSESSSDRTRIRSQIESYDASTSQSYELTWDGSSSFTFSSDDDGDDEDEDSTNVTDPSGVTHSVDRGELISEEERMQMISEIAEQLDY